jgi:hypothetical protein
MKSSSVNSRPSRLSRQGMHSTPSSGGGPDVIPDHIPISGGGCVEAAVPAPGPRIAHHFRAAFRVERVSDGPPARCHWDPSLFGGRSTLNLAFTCRRRACHAWYLVVAGRMSGGKSYVRRADVFKKFLQYSSNFRLPSMSDRLSSMSLWLSAICSSAASPIRRASSITSRDAWTVAAPAAEGGRSPFRIGDAASSV